jgi:hypothetical protein
MGHVVRRVAFRARQDGRQGRLGWLLLVSAVNLVLWGGLIALVTRLS